MESNYLIDNFDLKFNSKEFSSFDDINENEDDDDELVDFMNFDLDEELKNFMINNEDEVLNKEEEIEKEEKKEEIIQEKVEKEAEPEVEEGEDHLPRVQIELDRLNYTNESINNLELELEV